MHCHACGAEVAAESVYCHRCGARLDQLGEEGNQGEGRSHAESGPSAERVFSPRNSRDDDDDREEELWEGGYSPKAMLGSWILAGVLSVLAIVAGLWLIHGDWATTLWMILLGLIVVGWLYLLVQLAYRRMSVSYRLTSQQFVHRKGVLSQLTDRIEVIDMDDIAYRQSLIERLVGVGTVEITSSDRSHPTLLLKGIDDVQQIAKLLDSARRRERMRRGIHIESI